MGGRRGKNLRHSKRLPAGGVIARTAKRERIARRCDEHRRRDEARKRGEEPWVSAKRPVIQFALIFAVLMALFYAAYYMPVSRQGVAYAIHAQHLGTYAKVSGAIISAFGQDITVDGRFITSSVCSVEITRGCDAMDATALFICAVIALPVRRWRKLLGIVGGVAALVVINLTRIVGLFYIGVHFPDLFETMHVNVLQAVVVFLTMLLWGIWAWWATQSKMVRSDVSA